MSFLEPDLIAEAYLVAGNAARRVQIDLADSLVAAVGGATAQTARSLVALGRAIARGLADDELLAAHTHIAGLAQDSVLRSYAYNVTGKEKTAGKTHYRTAARNPRNHRYANNALRRALGNKTFWEATPWGIRFINIDLLDREARHWARLNAGAGERGHGSRRTFAVNFSNLVVASIGLQQEPRPSFYMPYGYFYDPNSPTKTAEPSEGARGEHQFYPAKSGPLYYRRRQGLYPRNLSRGIEARNFLDAGVARIADELGPAYQHMYERLWDRGIIAARASARSVAGSRPTNLFSSHVRAYTNY